MITREQLEQPIPCKCARCGGDATIIAIGERGVCVCPRCTFPEHTTLEEYNDETTGLFG